MMAKEYTPKVVTANDLLEGDVIYMTTSGEWSREHAQAELFSDEVAAKAALEKASAQQERIVGAYLADAVLNQDGVPEPVHFREVFRTRGPSNYPQFGKQAEI